MCSWFRTGCWIAWLSLTGCNAVLGIEPPSNRVLNPNGNMDASLGTNNPSSSSPRDSSLPEQDNDGGDAPAQPPLMALEHAWASWPVPSVLDAGLPNPQIFRVDTEGVVTDTVTNLEWQQVASTETFTWDEATQHCTSLELAGGGFRVPTRIELISIRDYSASLPAMDTNAFPNAPSERFWTASPFDMNRNQAWAVNFGFSTSSVNAQDKDKKYFVRCVR